MGQGNSREIMAELDISGDMAKMLDSSEFSKTVDKRVVTPDVDKYGRVEGDASNVDTEIEIILVPMVFLTDKEETGVGWISPYAGFVAYIKGSDEIAVGNEIVDGSDVYEVIETKQFGISQTESIYVCGLILK